MRYFICNFTTIICFCFPVIKSCLAVLFQADTCNVDGYNGKCLNFLNCQYAIDNLRQFNKTPPYCWFVGKAPKVCCPDEVQPAVAIIGSPYENLLSKRVCVRKCEEYHNSLRNFFSFIFYVRGSSTAPREFTHMAILGYGPKNDSNWLCGGSLISKNYVLTAAHCLHSLAYGRVNKVRLGEHDVKSSREDADPIDYDIQSLFPHPSYKYSSHYNDIALIKLDSEVSFTKFIKPACLHPNFEIPTQKIVVTGWGKTHFFEDRSSQLMQAEVEVIGHDSCAKAYEAAGGRRLQHGILDKIQICAGSENGNDACEGDSGGPVQFKVSRRRGINAHYAIVGIISFGKHCMGNNSIGVNTRLAPFITWIEHIVWPNG